jgi:uncharacterized protein (DUF2132 family)
MSPPDEPDLPDTAAAQAQPKNPLHGLTLQAVVTALVAHYGWPGLAERIPLRCFSSDPSVASSLKGLRKTPWARDKVESLYLFMLRETRRAHEGQGQGQRQGQGQGQGPGPGPAGARKPRG